MNEEKIKTATGGETTYKNKRRISFILAIPATITFCGILLYFLLAQVEPLILMIVTLAFAVDFIVLIVFIGKSPNIVLSPRYFGFTRYFGVYRVRWDRVKQVEDTGYGTAKKVIITFLNDKGVSEKIALNPAHYPIGDGLIDEMKRLRAGGY
ncbi:MAG: hypothetical protein GY771_10760 [bacterium]|nr:hypothetical protein [bacterium]